MEIQGNRVTLAQVIEACRQNFPDTPPEKLLVTHDDLMRSTDGWVYTIVIGPE